MAVVTSSNKGAFPDVQFFPPEDVVPDALIMSTGTYAAPVEGDEPVVRVPFVSEDVDAEFVPEGQDIDLDQPDLDQLVVPTGKVAVLTKVSREAYSHEGIAGLLTASLRRSVTVKADSTYLGSSLAPLGLAHTVGVNAIGTMDDSLDAIHDAITAVRLAGGDPSHVLMDPASWGVISKLKQGTGSNVPLVDANSPTLVDLPRLVSSHMPAGTVLVIDKSQIITVYGQLALALSEHRYFEGDALGLRVTWRVGWGIVRPERIAKVTVTIPDDGS